MIVGTSSSMMRSMVALFCKDIADTWIATCCGSGGGGGAGDTAVARHGQAHAHHSLQRGMTTNLSCLRGLPNALLYRRIGRDKPGFSIAWVYALERGVKTLHGRHGFGGFWRIKLWGNWLSTLSRRRKCWLSLAFVSRIRQIIINQYYQHLMFSSHCLVISPLLSDKMMMILRRNLSTWRAREKWHTTMYSIYCTRKGYTKKSRRDVLMTSRLWRQYDRNAKWLLWFCRRESFCIM